MTLLGYTHPEEPTGLRATAAGPRAVDLAWAAPEVTGSGGIAGYRIERSDDGGVNWTDLVADTAGTTYRDETIGPVETRHYRVRAINGLRNTGPPSVPTSVTTQHGVRSIEVTSTPVHGDTYLAGEAIEVTVMLSRDADLFDASLALSVGNATAAATCVKTSENCAAAPSAVFRYVVEADALDEDGIGWAANALSARAYGTGDLTPIDLTHPATGSFSGHKVDGRALTVSVAKPEDVPEGKGMGPFVATLSRAVGHAVEVTWSTADGTATAGEDYTAAAGTVTFAAGKTIAVFGVDILDDTLDEADETLVLTLDSATGGATVDAVAASATMTLLDDDDPPSVTAAPVSATEGEDAVLAVRLSGPSGREVAVSWYTVDGTAKAGADYTAVADGSLTLAAGETQQMLTVSTLDDTLREEAETFYIWLRRQPYAGETAPDEVVTSVTVAADGDPVFASGGYSTPGSPTESLWSATLTVAVDGGNRGLFTASGTDYGSLSGSAEFLYGVTNFEVVELRNSTTGTLFLGLETESLQGNLSNLVLQLGDRYFPLWRFESQVDSDFHLYRLGDVRLGWSADDSVEARILAFTAPGAPTLLTAAADGPQAVDLSWTAPEIDGGGIGGYRVEISEDGGVRWRTVETNTGSPATAYRDGAAGPGRTRTYRIGAVSVSGIVGPASDTASATPPHGIASIDVTSAPGSSSGTYFIGETFEVTVTMSTPAEIVGASLDLALGAATVPAVCETQTDRCMAAPRVVFRYTVRKDEVDADGIAWAADPLRGAVFEVGSALAIDSAYRASEPLAGHKVDGRAPTVSVTKRSDVAEGGVARFEVVLSHAVGHPVEVTWSTADATATAGEDYTAAAGTETLAADQRSATLTVESLDDTLDETDETFVLTLSAASGGAEVDADAASATMTLIDDDDPPLVTATDISVAEGEDAVLAVALSAPSGREVVVTWKTADVTATAGADYTAVADGRLTFAPGETQRALTVSTLDDLFSEDAETFLVRLERQAYGAETAPDAVVATVTVSADGDLVLIPPQVTGVEVRPSVRHLEVSWMRPDMSPGLGEPTGYTVQWKSGGQSFDASREMRVMGAATTSVSVRLAVGVAHTVRVIATNADADGQPSAESDAVTPFAPQQLAPLGKVFWDADLKVGRYEAQGYVSYGHIWNNSSGDGTVDPDEFTIGDLGNIHGFSVYYHEDTLLFSTFDYGPFLVLDVDERRYRLGIWEDVVNPGANLGDSLAFFRPTGPLQAFCHCVGYFVDDHGLDWIEGERVKVRLSILRPPEAPDVTATSGETEVLLRWTEPDSDLPIEKYEYRVSVDDGRTWNPDWTDVPDNDGDSDFADERAHTVTGLANGTEYVFEMRAQSGPPYAPVTRVRASPTVREDATLASLAVGGSDGPFDLNPDPFDPATFGYSVDVPWAVSRVTIAAPSRHTEAVVAWLDANGDPITDADAAAEHFQMDPPVGTTVVSIRVTAPDGTARKTYTLTLVRAEVSRDAALAALEVTQGGNAIALDPAPFGPDVLRYAVTVPNAVRAVTVAPTTRSDLASHVFLDGSDDALAGDGAGGLQVPLAVGDSTVKVKVTAEDGATVRIYTLRFARDASSDATLEAWTLLDGGGGAVALASSTALAHVARG